MKKKTIYILFTILAIVIVYAILFIDFKTNVGTLPQKPDIVPDTAIWSGGLDGGYWFDFIEYNKNTKEYTFVIYEQTNGTVELNGKFVQKNNCANLPIDSKILEKINFFANDKIVLDDCTLIKVD